MSVVDFYLCKTVKISVSLEALFSCSSYKILGCSWVFHLQYHLPLDCVLTKPYHLHLCIYNMLVSSINIKCVNNNILCNVYSVCIWLSR